MPEARKIVKFHYYEPIISNSVYGGFESNGNKTVLVVRKYDRPTKAKTISYLRNVTENFHSAERSPEGTLETALAALSPDIREDIIKGEIECLKFIGRRLNLTARAPRFVDVEYGVLPIEAIAKIETPLEFVEAIFDPQYNEEGLGRKVGFAVLASNGRLPKSKSRAHLYDSLKCETSSPSLIIGKAGDSFIEAKTVLDTVCDGLQTKPHIDSLAQDISTEALTEFCMEPLIDLFEWDLGRKVSHDPKLRPLLDRDLVWAPRN